MEEPEKQKNRFRPDGRQPFPYQIMEGLPDREPLLRSSTIEGWRKANEKQPAIGLPLAVHAEE